MIYNMLLIYEVIFVAILKANISYNENFEETFYLFLRDQLYNWMALITLIAIWFGRWLNCDGKFVVGK